MTALLLQPFCLCLINIFSSGLGFSVFRKFHIAISNDYR
jgi:hypothetical protein